MKRSRAVVFGVLAVGALTLTGCAGLSPAEVDAFLVSIPAEIPDLRAVDDGAYEGAYRIDPPRGETAFLKHVSVRVSVADHDVAAIEITDPRALAGDPDFADYAQRVAAADSLAVDGVSGATYSSKAFAKAVENALIGAAARGR